MINSIQKQIETNKSLNLLFKNLSGIVNVDKDFRQEVLRLKQDGFPLTDSLVEKTIQKTLTSIYAVNQYIQIDEAGIACLNELYRATYTALTAANFENIMEVHFNRLSEIIGRYYPASFKTALQDTAQIGAVTNEQYSAEFQLDFFDIDMDDLLEPIIDIGCGSRAHFVNALRSRGLEAVGIDRLIDSPADNLIKISWFDFEFRPAAWGTIYANMSFSNHFVYTLQNDRANLLQYIKKYEELLDALKTDGELIYAPSVPQLEELVLADDRFTLDHRHKTPTLSVTRVRRLA